jgi:site-specific DNA-cytosine methylase
MTCEIDKGMRESIMRRLNVPCHDDMRTIVDTKMPIASILVATPPCQDWSIAGHALGPEGKHAHTIGALLELVDKGVESEDTGRQQFDMIVMGQVPGMQSWCGPGEHLLEGRHRWTSV